MLTIDRHKSCLKAIFAIILFPLSACSNEKWIAPTVDSDEINIVHEDQDYGFEKYNVVSRMYSDAVMNKYNESNDTLDHLYKYSDKKLKSIILLTKERSTDDFISLNNKRSCMIAINTLDLIPSTSYKLDDILETDFKILQNGNVRARMLVKGYKDIDRYNFGTFKDFSFNCENGSCMITDVFDFKGNSAKMLVQELCQ